MLLWNDLYDMQQAATARLSEAETAHLKAGGALHYGSCEADLTTTSGWLGCDDCSAVATPTLGTVNTRHEYVLSAAHRLEVLSIPHSQINFKR